MLSKRVKCIIIYLEKYQYIIDFKLKILGIDYYNY